MRIHGFYYYCFSKGGNSLWVAKAKHLGDLDVAEPVCVYTAPEGTPYSKNYWAPELHLIDNSWIIYVAADNGHNEFHRMFALTADQPQAPFHMVGQITSPDNHWAIDGTAFSFQNQLYFVWSGWEGDTNISQQLYIAPMADPFTICGNRICISRPQFSWERQGIPLVNEGPAVLIKNNTLHLVYSASGSWTDDYCLGLLTLKGNDPLRPSDWAKTPMPVFSKSNTAYGPGHCSFTTNLNGTQDWIVYHANEISGSGWGGRSVRAQPFTWRDNVPVFDPPLKVGSVSVMDD